MSNFLFNDGPFDWLEQDNKPVAKEKGAAPLGDFFAWHNRRQNTVRLKGLEPFVLEPPKQLTPEEQVGQELKDLLTKELAEIGLKQPVTKDVKPGSRDWQYLPAYQDQAKAKKQPQRSILDIMSDVHDGDEEPEGPAQILNRSIKKVVNHH